MTVLWFKQVEFNYRKQESCEQGSSWIVKFSHYLHFQYHKYGIIFSIRTQNGCSNCTDEEKKSVKWTIFDTFDRKGKYIGNWLGFTENLDL